METTKNGCLHSMTRRTVFSPCRDYRYTLWREWDMHNPTYAMFIGLNPSTADEVQDDPTVRRCIRFAKEWGYGALCMMNAFSYRATDPVVMKAQAAPVGADNDRWLVEIAQGASIIIAAWGVHGVHHGRSDKVRQLLDGNTKLHCLGRTKAGLPKHPLYLAANTQPVLY